MSSLLYENNWAVSARNRWTKATSVVAHARKTASGIADEQSAKTVMGKAIDAVRRAAKSAVMA